MYRLTCVLPLCRGCGFSVQGLVKGTFRVPSREHPSDCLPPPRLGICEVGSRGVTGPLGLSWSCLVLALWLWRSCFSSLGLSVPIR